MVQLKGSPVVMPAASVACFNSKMVQLKATSTRYCKMRTWFQFQNGSIKSPVFHNHNIQGSWFQFQNGSIKSKE